MEPMVRWEGGYGHNEPNTAEIPKLVVKVSDVTVGDDCFSTGPVD
jgi:hypothetical protein